jgi:hypothetical protein
MIAFRGHGLGSGKFERHNIKGRRFRQVYGATVMFKMLFPYAVTIIPGTCGQHPDCTEYSVIPDDPNKHRHELHSAGPNIATGELTMEMLAAIIGSHKTDQ